MHFSLPPPIFDSDTLPCSLQFQDAELTMVETSTVPYPKTHGHYNPIHLNPLVKEKERYLLLSMNKDGRACYEYPAGSDHRLQLQYHFARDHPMPCYENSPGGPCLATLHKW